VQELILSIDPNHDGSISYEEFAEVMKHIEDRLINSNKNTLLSSTNVS
jgi:Ca2+-binding EF-hand superfamily protein